MLSERDRYRYLFTRVLIPFRELTIFSNSNYLPEMLSLQTIITPDKDSMRPTEEKKERKKLLQEAASNTICCLLSYLTRSVGNASSHVGMK